MRILEYNLSHPYPRNDLFTTITLVLIALVTPVLVLVNSERKILHFPSIGG